MTIYPIASNGHWAIGHNEQGIPGYWEGDLGTQQIAPEDFLPAKAEEEWSDGRHSYVVDDIFNEWGKV